MFNLENDNQNDSLNHNAALEIFIEKKGIFASRVMKNVCVFFCVTARTLVPTLLRGNAEVITENLWPCRLTIHYHGETKGVSGFVGWASLRSNVIKLSFFVAAISASEIEEY